MRKYFLALIFVMASSFIFYNTTNADKLGSGNQSKESAKAIMASGTFYDNGTVKLDDWYVLPEAELSTLFPGPYKFEYLDTEGKVLRQINFDISFKLWDSVLTEARFIFTIPYIPGTKRIAVLLNDTILAEKIFSPHIPKVTVIAPNGGETYAKEVTVRWMGSDADNDKLLYALLISVDSGVSWKTVATDLIETSYVVDVSSFSAGEKYRVKVIATDGINTGEDLSDSSFTIQR